MLFYTPQSSSARREDPAVTILQGGLNQILGANGYGKIPVSGLLDARTCAALGLADKYFTHLLRTQIPYEIWSVAKKSCDAAAQQDAAVKNLVLLEAKQLEPDRVKAPTEVLHPQTTTADTPVNVVQTTAPVPVPVVIEQTQIPQKPSQIESPQLSVEARPADKNLWIGLAVVGLAAFLILRKKK